MLCKFSFKRTILRRIDVMANPIRSAQLWTQVRGKKVKHVQVSRVHSNISGWNWSFWTLLVIICRWLHGKIPDSEPISWNWILKFYLPIEKDSTSLSARKHSSQTNTNFVLGSTRKLLRQTKGWVNTSPKVKLTDWLQPEYLQTEATPYNTKLAEPPCDIYYENNPTSLCFCPLQVSNTPTGANTVHQQNVSVASNWQFKPTRTASVTLADIARGNQDFLRFFTSFQQN